MRRAARRDANHKDVGDYLRSLGWSVLDLASHACGCDYAVGKPGDGTRRGFAAIVEVKDGAKVASARKLTPKEQKLRDEWGDLYIVALDGEDAAVQLLCLMNGWGEGRYDL